MIKDRIVYVDQNSMGWKVDAYDGEVWDEAVLAALTVPKSHRRICTN